MHASPAGFVEPSVNGARILLVEDDAPLRESLRRGLLEAGYDVIAADRLGPGEAPFQGGPVDLVLLDRMLPGGDGLEHLARWRAEGRHCPVILLTARDTIDDRIDGLNRGADDYLVKPFSFGELVARVRALLRRQAPSYASQLRVDDLELDVVERRALRGGRRLDVTPRQFDLLAYLMRHAGRIVTREMIARDVWKESTATWTNVIEVQINRLRKKLGDGERPLLHTVRGAGYRLGDET